MIHAPKGIEDVLPPRAASYAELERKASELFATYGYELIRIPTLEKTELFVRSVGSETDVGKQMYTFEDKGGRSLSLRPEGTAGVARAYVEHKLYGSAKTWGVYYCGSMFRYERPQAGRLREFYQIGVEMFGESNLWVDAEVIQMASRFFEQIGLRGVEVVINSIGCPECRRKYIEALKHFLEGRIDSFCSDCQRRFQYNPLRILDCKKPGCREQLHHAPMITEYLCSKCAQAFSEVQENLGVLNVSFKHDDRLVRGLDYYTGTIFEVVAPQLGAQSTVCAGGRYDGLVEQLGGPATPALGFALGVERVLIALTSEVEDGSQGRNDGVFFATMGKEAIALAARLASATRLQGITSVVNLQKRSLSTQLRHAVKDGYSWVFVIGEQEVKAGKYTLKDMQSGNQLSVGEQDMGRLPRFLKEARGQ